MFGIPKHPENLESTAQVLYETWDPRAGYEKFWGKERGLSLEIGTAQGRFELLLYTILLGAKVQPEAVARTFHELQTKGLSSLDYLAKAQENVLTAIQRVFARHYRALTPRRRKATAIIEAALKVKANYAGDIGSAYQVADQDSQRVLELIQSFPGINLRGLWFCREMKYAGIWPQLDNSVCLAIDGEIKTPLWYLGFVGQDCYYLRDVTTKECLGSLQKYFEGNPFPLLARYRTGCAKGDSQICAAACKVYQACQIRFSKSAGCF